MRRVAWGMRRVIVESPFRTTDIEVAGHSITIEETDNVAYARACMRDCLRRGESPYASHLLYTQPGVLDDSVPEERAQGIEAGLVWKQSADASIVYYDRGITKGMILGIQLSAKIGQPVEYRQLGGEWAVMEIAAMSLDELLDELRTLAHDAHGSESA